MRHDPEQAAAAYLAGELDRRARTRFERHLLDCEDCWHETSTARTGRMLAESLRETAPAALRERIRAIATLPATRPPARTPVPPPPRRTSPGWWPYTLIAAAAVAVLVLVVAVIPEAAQPQPAALAEAATLYRTGGPGQDSPDEEPPVPQIADYRWQGATRGQLAGLPATVHTYTTPAGRLLLVVTSPQRFPRAVDARGIEPAPSWIADVDGTTMLCADQPGISWLAVAATSDDALTAGRALGLTSS